MRFVALIAFGLLACSAGRAPAPVVVAERPAARASDSSGACYTGYHRSIAACRAESRGAPDGDCINAAEVKLNACLDGHR